MKKRQINKRVESRKDSDGNLLCLIPSCDKERVMGKNGRLRNYCGDHTYDDIGPFIHWPDLRMKAFKRDDYSCVKCGKKPLKDSCRKNKKPEVNTSALIGDHIIPIALGGDEFDINNVQTLCKKCDKIKTAQDHQDIAKQRRVKRVKRIIKETRKKNKSIK